MKIGYIFVIAELFHFGHLQFIKAAKNNCAQLICGLLTDKAVQAFRSAPVTSYDERKQVLEAIRYIDQVIPQHEQNPTANLKLIKTKHPEAELIFAYGDNWQQTPGGEYLCSVKAKIIQQSFYERLSDENIFVKTITDRIPALSSVDTFTNNFLIKDFNTFLGAPPSVVITTKANTLQTLKPLLHKSFIENTFVFQVAGWQCHKNEIVEKIGVIFNTNKIIIRSSSLNEDSPTRSMAGHYHSAMNIPATDTRATIKAITQVIASYDEHDPLHKLNQVLVQRQTDNIQLSGVAFTADLETNAPYYVINYAEGNATDKVTAGLGGKMLKIFRDTDRSLLHHPWDILIAAIEEIEQIIQNFSLDIEFAITKDDRVILFQVRPLAANHNIEQVDSSHTNINIQAVEQHYQSTLQTIKNSQTAKLVFSDMLFWNPAELIGHSPGNLAYSLFDRLIMKKAWNAGLVALGYPEITNNLMERFLFKPYINANIAFLAMTPCTVAPALHAKLLPYFLTKLENQPFLHDKAEFKIMFSCYDFNIDSRLEELTNHNFSSKEINSIRTGLIDFTLNILHNYKNIADNLQNNINVLERFNDKSLPIEIDKIKNTTDLHIVEELLDMCEEYGVIPFVSAARLAFIADALFQSLESSQVITRKERDSIMNSFSTIARELTEDMGELNKGTIDPSVFYKKYGHLRYGTYDIEQPRYDTIFNNLPPIPSNISHSKPSAIEKKLQDKISTFTLQTPLALDFDTLYEFTSLFIQRREYYKFVYTKTISNALERLKEAGLSLSISPADISHLDIETILSMSLDNKEAIQEKIRSEKKKRLQVKHTILPPLIFQAEDFCIQHYPLTSPNFITSLVVQGEVLCLQKSSNLSSAELNGKIVLIENADPGYHWLFSTNFKGLITKYGGICSHMAICCAEFNIPAAIGCGENYDQLKKQKRIILDCNQQKIQEAHQTV